MDANPQEAGPAVNSSIEIESSNRGDLPSRLRYGMVRPLFAFQRYMRVVPTSGFTSYIENQEIIFALPTGSRLWLSGARSYILADLVITLPKTCGVQLDYDTHCLQRQWRVMENTTLTEQIDHYNLFHPIAHDVGEPILANYSKKRWNGGNLVSYTAGETARYTNTSGAIDNEQVTAYNIPQGNFTSFTTATRDTSNAMNLYTEALTVTDGYTTGGPYVNLLNSRSGLQIVNTNTSASLTMTQQIKINCPSTIVGYRQQLLYPLAFARNVNVYFLLEYGQIAFVPITNNDTTSADTVKALYSTMMPNKYILQNVYWYLNCIELGGDILKKVAAAYISGTGPGGESIASYFYPTLQLVHRTVNVISSTSSVSIPFSFNILSAHAIVFRLSRADSFAATDTAFAQYSCSNRVGGVSKFSLQVNGVQLPQAAPIASDVSSQSYPVYGTTATSTDQTMEIYRLFQHSCEAMEVFGIRLNSESCIQPFTYNSLSDVVASSTTSVSTVAPLGSRFGMFFFGLSFEPSPVIDDFTSKAGIVLSAGSDLILNLEFSTVRAITFRIDAWVIASVEIGHSGAEIKRNGGF